MLVRPELDGWEGRGRAVATPARSGKTAINAAAFMMLDDV